MCNKLILEAKSPPLLKSCLCPCVTIIGLCMKVVRDVYRTAQVLHVWIWINLNDWSTGPFPYIQESKPQQKIYLCSLVLSCDPCSPVVQVCADMCYVSCHRNTRLCQRWAIYLSSNILVIIEESVSSDTFISEHEHVFGVSLKSIAHGVLTTTPSLPRISAHHLPSVT